MSGGGAFSFSRRKDANAMTFFKNFTSQNVADALRESLGRTFMSKIILLRQKVLHFFAQLLLRVQMHYCIECARFLHAVIARDSGAVVSTSISSFFSAFLFFLAPL